MANLPPQHLFYFGLLVKLASATLLFLGGLALSMCGFFVVKNEVRRQPDADSAWFTLWVGIAIFGVGQGCAVLTGWLFTVWF